MGFSYNSEAGRAVEAVQAKFGSGERMGNVLTIGERRFFYEIARRDQDDGGIRGTMNLFTDARGNPSMAEEESWARRIGYFKVDGGGRIVRWPGLPLAWVREWNQRRAALRLV